MKQRLKVFLAASALLSAPLAVPAAALAQATTSAESTTAPTPEQAEQMKANSYKVHNPTEENKTFQNQRQEQPDPSAPKAPPTDMDKTGRSSDKLPISSPAHDHKTGHKSGHKHHHRMSTAGHADPN